MFLYGDIIDLYSSKDFLFVERMTTNRKELLVINHSLLTQLVKGYKSFLSRIFLKDLPYAIEKKFLSINIQNIKDSLLIPEMGDLFAKILFAVDDKLLTEIKDLVNKSSFVDGFSAFGCPLSDFKDGVGCSYIKYYEDFILCAIRGEGLWNEYVSISNCYEHIILGTGDINQYNINNGKIVFPNGDYFSIKRLGVHFYL